MSVKELAAARLARVAFDRCERHHDATLGPFRAWQEVTFNILEQTHHGTTDYALAAWWQLRDRFRGRVRMVRGEPAYRVPDMAGDRVLETPALALVRNDELTLYLTGCSWGYGGEGPHGTAVVLADVGLFRDLDMALAFAAGRPREWRQVPF